MAKTYWLVKQEPEDYSWDDFVNEGETAWTGVRNFQARNNLNSMKAGDSVLYYHSGDQKSVVGIAKVIKEAYPDPTADDGNWVCVDIAPVKPLHKPVALGLIKGDPQLKNMKLVKQSRLSVTPVTREEFDRIVELSKSRSSKES